LSVHDVRSLSAAPGQQVEDSVGGALLGRLGSVVLRPTPECPGENAQPALRGR
jgi:hypothetical protein